MEDINMDDYDIEEISLNEAMGVDVFSDDEAEPSSEEKALQQKYVNGEISFTEYSSRLGALFENLEAEDPLENDPEEITLELQDTSESMSLSQVEEIEKDKNTRKDLIVRGKLLEEKKIKISRPRVKLEGALKGLLGQATMMFVRKENQQKAIELVLEVVRQCPNAPEAYKTLATMYDEIGNKETSIKMSLIGAHLSSNNAEEWVQLGGHFEREGDKQQAIGCYNKALKADVTLVHIHDRRAQLCDEIDMRNKGFILVGYRRFLKNITRDSSPQTVLDIATRTAHFCHTMRNVPAAASALQTALEFCGDLINPSHINLYLELLLEMKRYESCVNVLQRYAHIQIDYVKTEPGPREKGDTSERNIKIINYQLPLPLPPPEIIAKFCATFVHLKFETEFDRLIHSLDLDVETYGDLYLDISEALVQEKYYQHAVQVLKRLIASTKYNQPGVWKQLAETYEKAGLMEDCKLAYRTVLEKVPLMLDIRRHLSEIYMKEGNTAEAVDALRQIVVPGETLPDHNISQTMEQDPLAIIKSEPGSQSNEAIPKPQRLDAFQTNNVSIGKKSLKTVNSKTSKTGTVRKFSYKKPALPALRYKPKYNRSSASLHLYPVSSMEETLDGKSEIFSCHLRESNDLISAPLLLDQLVLMMKTELSYVQKDEYFSLLNLLLSQNSIMVKNLSEAKVVMTRGRIQKKIDVITTIRGLGRETVLDNRQYFQPDTTINTQDLFSVYHHGLDIAKKTEDYYPMIEIILLVFGNPIFFSDSLPTSHLDQMTLEASLVLYRTKHMDFCYLLFRIILHRFLDSKVVLNLINLLMMGVSDQNIFRNTMRIFQSRPDNFGLNVLYANHCLLASNYRYCINEYTIISKYLDHKHPLYLLLLGCSYANIACNRGIDKKSLLATHALAWMSKYKETRGSVMSQEVLYNLGRMYHQLGLLTQAVSCYEQALASKPCRPHYNLQSEIAYNLYLIYLSSRSFNLAKHIINTYLVV